MLKGSEADGEQDIGLPILNELTLRIDRKGRLLAYNA